MFYLISIVAILCMYVYMWWTYNKFSRLGINNLPVTPLLGSVARLIFKREFVTDIMERTYRTFPDDKIIGYFEFMQPIFLINDVEVLKKITVRDHEYFVNRRTFPDEFKNTLFTKNLMALKGDQWKSMRLTLSPAFTGSKIRAMVPFMKEVADHMVNYLRKEIDGAEVDYIDVETKDMTSRCVNDILASCVYGISVNSAGSDNEFFVNCKEASNVSARENIVIMFIRTFPKLATALNLTLKPELSKYFTKLVLDIITYREEHNVERNDMMHILKEAKKEWPDQYLVPQAILFLVAGFETVATGLAFILHELALHPEIQERLYQEIKENYDINNGIFDCNSVLAMTYLDMVLSEGLRMWPPAVQFERKCVKDYNMGRISDKAKSDLIFRKHDEISVSVFAFHRNPRYFPDPEKFDPERFSEKNKHNIKPFTYIPFGAGPRGCIGGRFARIEMKVVLYMLLLNVEVTSCEKTCVPTQLAVQDAFPRIKGGHWLRMKLRTI